MSERTRDRILFQLKSRGALSAAAVARRVQMSTVAVRQHLTGLESEGLVESAREAAARVGRPTMLWNLTAHGHRLFPDKHADLTLEILDAARTAFGRDGVDKLITARSKSQRARYRKALANAATTKERVAALARLRRQEGYMAEWKASGDHFLLIENHCPICTAARACQGLCAQELQLFQQVLGKGVEVERTEHLFDGARRCTYKIGEKERGSRVRRPDSRS